MLTTYRALLQASKDLYHGGHWGNPALFVRMWLQGILNFRSVAKIYRNSPYGNISEILTDEPHFLGMLVWPLVDARWPPKRRLHELMLHFKQVAALGSLLRLQPRQIKSILKLDAVCAGLDLCLESQPWFAREGQCTLSLFYAGERTYSVAFLLSEKNGKRIAYIGAVQGVKQTEDSDTYKMLTKAAHGLRPRDLGIALFLLLCQAMRVERVLAVADSNRQHQHSYFDPSQRAVLFASYDAIWTENGASPQADGLFALTPGLRRKDLTEVPSKKRSMYRKREVFLEECLAALTKVVQSALHRHPDDACDIPCDIAGPATPLAIAQPPRPLPSVLARNWLDTAVRPVVLGPWLWSFPVVFM